MAVDPATAKLLARLAVKIATDKNARKRVFFLVIAPLVAFLLLIAMILQILTSPFQLISTYFRPDELTHVNELRTDYGFTQMLQTDEEGYQESLGQQYDGIHLKSGHTEVVYYNQLDSRWADTMYGISGTIGEAGCGPTSLAMVVSTLTDMLIDPVSMSDWSYQNGYRAEGNGSYHSLIPEGGKHFGLQVEGVQKKDSQKIIDALSSGKLVITIMSKGHFTSSGHFLVLRGVTEDGKLLVADSASKKRSQQEWDLSLIVREARENAAAGGPFWILSKE
ncbi:C39 family peptidase [Paenibacillus luteus]|uniref:C39 family peptidase n=1 Tax=Paenibacillus luteus TaxID=2545753 RepID=UPI001143A2D3|nr:C39 family peptidase [Paenibacillus luteus]